MCSKSKLAKLREKVASFEEPPKVAIMMHSNPDPDCIGAACGVVRLIKSIEPDAQCTMVYSGEISHPQNKTMVNILKLQMTHRNDIEELSDVGDIFVTVDVIPERCNMKDVDCFLAIDHHKSDTKKSQLKDIRQVGSTSAIIWDYLRTAEISLNESEEDADVATALAIGIRTDTQELTENASELDYEAYKDLMSKVNMRSFKSINNYPIPPYHFELRKRLDQEANTISKDGVFIGGMGYIPPSKRDILSTFSEERSRAEGTETAFVFAIVGDNIEVSVRSVNTSFDVNLVCQEIFGKDRAGGKMGAGAAKFPLLPDLGTLSEDGLELLWCGVRGYIVEKIFKKLHE